MARIILDWIFVLACIAVLAASVPAIRGWRRQPIGDRINFAILALVAVTVIRDAVSNILGYK